MKIINDERFCSVQVEVYFINDANTQLSVRNLLCKMLVDSSQKYFTKKMLREALDDMYGATLSARTQTIGKKHVICLSGNVIADEYTMNKETNIQNYLAFLQEILYNPLLNNQKLAEMKTKQLSLLKRNKEDVESYSIKEAFNTLDDDILSLNNLGDEQVIKTITLADIQGEYQRMLKEDIIRVYIAGKLTNIDFINDQHTLTNVYHNIKKHELKTTVIKRESSQSFINLIYNLNELDVKANLAILIVTNYILGGFNGLLFNNLREKASLCYLIYSRLLSFEGVVHIHSGVSYNNIHRSIEAINDQITLMKNGEFDDDLIDKAKKNIIMEYQQQNDSLRGKISLAVNNDFKGSDDSLEMLIAKIQNVSKQQIIDCIKKWTLVHSHVVEGVANETN